MPWLRRFDGDHVTDVSPTRAIMPFLMRTRTSAAVYFEQELDVTKTMAALEARAARGQSKLGLFHVYTWAVVQTLAERPRLNRFTMGRWLYQRKHIEVAFSAKKAMRDDAPVVVVKRRLDPAASFEAHVSAVSGGISEGRSDTKTSTDVELGVLLALPGFLLAAFVALARWLDSHNLLPKALIERDPLYASLFVANLGSVGLDAVYHHLYEWGNCPIFAALGRVRVVGDRRLCTVRYTFDERIEDGLYCARALECLREHVERWDG
jgi:hypothetical protein